MTADDKPTGLTDEQIDKIGEEVLTDAGGTSGDYVREIARRIEAIVRDDSDSRHAGILDCLNQELRENGPVNVKQYGMRDDAREGVRLLVDNVRTIVRKDCNDAAYKRGLLDATVMDEELIRDRARKDEKERCAKEVEGCHGPGVAAILRGEK